MSHGGSKSFRKKWILTGLTCLGTAALFVVWSGKNRHTYTQEQANTIHSSTGANRISGKPVNGARAANHTSPYPTGNTAPNNSASGTTTGSTPHPDGPEVTRSSRRDTVVTPSGQRKALVDPMASWQNLPPWPEGPRLFAEVETSARRYVNLRPDDVGELPRIYAAAEERIELRVNFPEGEPGEKIYVEIPNGGSFPDTDKSGRVLELPSNRTLYFPFVTDEARGYCHVTVRHRGHTRSLPIWVGEPPESGSSPLQPQF